MENRSRVAIVKMINYADEVVSFTKDVSYDEFSNNRLVIAACVFNLSQIGELVKLVDKKLIDKYKNIKWVAIKNLRHRIVHDYEGIQIDLIWQIIKENIPTLILDLKEIIEPKKN